MADNDSVQKTLLVTLVLCVVCAVVVSAAAVLLRPQQAANQALNRKENILAAAGLLQPGIGVEQQFERVETRLVDLDSGRFTEALDAQGYDQRKASRDPALSAPVPQEQDIAKIQRRPKYAQVYLVRDGDGRLSRIVLPIKGYGLWSTLHGFIALEGDLNTVAGLGFTSTRKPRAWAARWTTRVGRPCGPASASTTRTAGRAAGDQGQGRPGRPEAVHQVDGLSGATLTSRGVDNLIHYWLGEQGFAPFLANLRAGAA